MEDVKRFNTPGIYINSQKQFRILTMILRAPIAKVAAESKLEASNVGVLLHCENQAPAFKLHCWVHIHAGFLQGPLDALTAPSRTSNI